MTNQQIILNARLRLWKMGLLSSGNRMIAVKDKNGDITTVKEPEEIHTYSNWKRHGRQVKPNEPALTHLNIWKHIVIPSNREEIPDKERMIRVRARFYKKSQTVPIP